MMFVTKEQEPSFQFLDQTASWKNLYRIEIYFIRKHEQPWSENTKYRFVGVSHLFFKTVPQHLIYIIALCYVCDAYTSQETYMSYAIQKNVLAWSLFHS